MDGHLDSEIGKYNTYVQTYDKVSQLALGTVLAPMFFKVTYIS